MRIVNSRTHGFVLVLDKEDVEYGQKCAKDPVYYQDETLRDHLDLFDSIVKGVEVKVHKYDPHVVPALISCAVIDDDDDRLAKALDVFDAYMQLVTEDWGYNYLVRYLEASYDLYRAQGIIDGFVLSLVEDNDDDWRWW